jgi:hypothetical protein
VEAALYFFALLYPFATELDSKGTPANNLDLNIALHILVFLVFSATLWVRSTNATMAIGLLNLLVYGLVVLLIYLMLLGSLLEVAYEPALAFFFAAANKPVYTIILAFFGAFLDWVVWECYSASKKLYPVRNHIEAVVSQGDTDGFEELLKGHKGSDLREFKLKVNFTTIIKRAFASTDSKPNTQPDISTIILNMLSNNSSDDSTSQFKPFSLSFNKKSLEKKYRIYTNNKYTLFKSLLLYSSIVGCFIWFISDFALSPGLSDRLNTSIYVEYIVIVIFFPLLFYLSYSQIWSKRTTTYTAIFDLILLFSSIFYIFVSLTDYTLLGVVIISFLSINYNTPFFVFIVLSGISLLGYAFSYSPSHAASGSTSTPSPRASGPTPARTSSTPPSASPSSTCPSSSSSPSRGTR